MEVKRNRSKSGGGAKKYNRNRLKCGRYLTRRQRIRNKQRKQDSFLRRLDKPEEWKKEYRKNHKIGRKREV